MLRRSHDLRTPRRPSMAAGVPEKECGPLARTIDGPAAAAEDPPSAFEALILCLKNALPSVATCLVVRHDEAAGKVRVSAGARGDAARVELARSVLVSWSGDGEGCDGLVRIDGTTTAISVRSGRVAVPAASTAGGHVCHVVLHREAEVSWHLIAVRDGAAFTGAEVTMILSFVPAFVVVQKAVLEAASARESLTSLTEVVDRMSAGVVFLDKAGDVVAMNESAHRVIKDTTPVDVERGRLVVRPDGGDAAHDVGRVLHRDHPAQDVFMVLRSCGESPSPDGEATAERVLHVQAAAVGPADKAAPGAPAVAVFIREPNKPTVDREVLRKSYDLSRVESEIVEHLSVGATPVEIGEAMRCSVHTVRANLKSIFRKTDARRQSDLVRIACRLSDILPAGR